MTDTNNPIPPLTRDDAAAHSGDVVAENVAALKALFPQIVTDGQVDFEVLRQLLGDSVEAGEERYGLNWKGKAKARAHALTPTLATLRPAKADSVDWDTTQNLVIEGDNLEVLKCLRKAYAGKIKLIYIDPPYNTGKDFVYPDNYTDSLSNYLELTGQRGEDGAQLTSNKEGSGRFHTDWLNMIYPRLMLAKDLLREDGVLAISMADNELDNLSKVIDDIFGPENNLAKVSVITGAHQSGDGVLVQKNVEYCLIVGRDVTSSKIERIDAVAETFRSLNDAPTPFSTRTDMGYTIYYNPKTGDWQPIFDYDASLIHTNDASLVYEDRQDLISQGFIPLRPGTRRGKLHRWRWGAETLIERRNEVVFLERNGEWRPAFRQQGYNPPKNVWNFSGGTAEVDALMGESEIFQYPKGLSFLSYVIQTCASPHALIMDFFAGSGTTGHAAMAQNAVDGGDRRFVLVQLPELLSPANNEQKAAADFCDKLGRPRNIAELTKERLRRAGAKVKADNPGVEVDTGFRVYKLDTSNLKPWQPDADNLEASLLDAVSNIVHGRSEDDLLVELLLKTGIDLTTPEELRQIAGKNVHALGGGALIVCLADITDGDAEALAHGMADWWGELEPAGQTTFYFKDTGFASASAKANVAAILRQRLGDRIAKLASI